MKKTSKFSILVLICIILSFFSFSVTFAAIDVENNSSINSITQTGTDGVKVDVDSNGKITYTPSKTGVYTIHVQGVVNAGNSAQNPDSSEDATVAPEDLYYELRDSSNKAPRLAAYYNEETGEYDVIGSYENMQSSVVEVILFEGETYTLGLSQSGLGPAYPYDLYSLIGEENYTASIEWNQSANSLGTIYQSDKPYQLAGDRNGFADMEEVRDGYQMPEDTEANVQIGQSGSDVVKSLLKGIDDWVINPVEETICELLLAMGDFLVNLMNDIIGEEVTITALVYNQVDAVNANFFDSSVGGNGITKDIKTVVNDWYIFFRLIAVAIYIVALLAIGLQILFNSTGGGMQKAKESLVKWVKGICWLVFVPYVVKYAFQINDALVAMLATEAGYVDYDVGTTFGRADEWSVEEIEFRSPEYVSKYTGSVTFGSDEYSKSYMQKLPTYEQKLDLMRIMRSYAGATKKLVYVIIWYILIGQLILFIVQYYKRYFMIAFLIAVFPIICIFNAITMARGGSGNEIGSWLKEILTNIFIQFVHAIIYTVITGICISVVSSDIQSSATLNWIIIILAINFVSEGEQLLKKLLGAMGSSVGGTQQTGKQVRGVVGKAREGLHKIGIG